MAHGEIYQIWYRASGNTCVLDFDGMLFVVWVCLRSGACDPVNDQKLRRRSLASNGGRYCAGIKRFIPHYLSKFRYFLSLKGIFVRCSAGTLFILLFAYCLRERIWDLKTDRTYRLFSASLFCLMGWGGVGWSGVGWDGSKMRFNFNLRLFNTLLIH